MKIVVTGTRGIPNIMGGVETHCEELYPRLSAMGFNVLLLRRSSYVDTANTLSSYKGVDLMDVYAPRLKSVEAIVHTFLSIIRAKRERADLLHIHAIGPAILTPFAKLLGLKVLFTHHGPDYDRQKWGRLAKFILKMGERMGTKYADEVIVISSVIAESLNRLYGRDNTNLIYNGVPKPNKSDRTDYIDSLTLTKGKYIVALGRFVEEKGFHHLVNVFSSLDQSEYKLVIAGDSDHPSTYSDSLKEQATSAGVILTGFIRGDSLNQLMSNAALFVLPSYHEGLPIALLEAMSYNLPVLVSDIPANLQVKGLTEDDYFRVGDEDDLLKSLRAKLSMPLISKEYDLGPYNWDTIADQVAQCYNKLHI
ncbi:MAG: glycosyltransferase family 4 protein [Bacteroidales bacterium]